MLYGAVVGRRAGKILAEQLISKTCPRCKGRMLPDGKDGDAVCFTCGNVVYKEGTILSSLAKTTERGPSHAGQSLD